MILFIGNIQRQQTYRGKRDGEIHGDGLGGGRNRAQLLMAIGFFLG